MIDIKLREAIEEITDGDAVVFDNPAFDGSIVGISYDGAVVYDMERMVAELSKEDNIPYDQALEFIEYNTVRSIPYCKIGTPPVIIDSNIEHLK